VELTVRHLGGTRFEAEARGHRVICDQPRDNGGMDEGMTPPEFLLASLATCAGYYAAEYLKTRSLSTGGLTVHINAEKALQPARLAVFQIEVSVPGLEDRHVTGVLRAVKACLIHNTLLGAPKIEVTVNPAGSRVSPGASVVSLKALN
jgi:putative redox protein